MPDQPTRRITVTRRPRVSTFTREDPLFEKTCPVCERSFQGPKRQVYDTPACLQRASYARNAELRRERRRERYRRSKGRA